MKAADVYAVSLERHAAQGWRRAGLLAWALLSVMSFGFVGTPSVGEWVVRRRSDGAEVLRLEAGAEEEAAALRGELDDQLARLTPSEFAVRWALARDGG